MKFHKGDLVLINYPFGTSHGQIGFIRAITKSDCAPYFVHTLGKCGYGGWHGNDTLIKIRSHKFMNRILGKLG